MNQSVKKYLKTLEHVVLAALITNQVYEISEMFIPAIANDMNNTMTVPKSLLHLAVMVGLQILYCFLLIGFRYGNSVDKIKNLTEDCRTELHTGLLADMKKMIHKEQEVLFTVLGFIVFSTIQWFVPLKLLASISNVFLGITGVSVFIPDLFIFLLFPEITPENAGLIVIFCMLCMLLGFFLFCSIYLFLLSRKRKKWCDEWKI